MQIYDKIMLLCTADNYLAPCSRRLGGVTRTPDTLFMEIASYGAQNPASNLHTMIPKNFAVHEFYVLVDGITPHRQVPMLLLQLHKSRAYLSGSQEQIFWQTEPMEPGVRLFLFVNIFRSGL